MLNRLMRVSEIRVTRILKSRDGSNLLIFTGNELSSTAFSQVSVQSARTNNTVSDRLISGLTSESEEIRRARTTR